MKMKLKMLGLLAVAVSATAFAMVDGFSVARKPKEGEEARYRMEADVEFAGMPVKAKFLFAEKVVKVEADGSYKVEQKQIEGKVEVNGQETEAPGGGTSTTLYAKDGDIKEITGENTGPDSYRMAVLGVLKDPGKTVAVNDTWTYEFKADSKLGTKAAKAEYKVVGEEKVGKWDTLKIQSTITETEGTDPASSKGTVWISKEDGSAVKLEQEWKNAPFPGAPGPLNATVKMTREG